MAAGIYASAYVTPAGGGAFDPETDITWASLFWTEGTAFTALSLSDGATAFDWPNETAEPDLLDSGTVSYDAANATFNGKPSVHYASSTDKHETGSGFTAITQPFTAVIISALVGTIVNRGGIVGTGGGFELRVLSAGSTIQHIAGNTLAGGSWGTSASLVMSVSNGASSKTFVNGTEEASGNAGTNNSQTDFAIMHSQPGDAVFVAYYDGDLTADGEYTNFKTWVSSHYGITIA